MDEIEDDLDRSENRVELEEREDAPPIAPRRRGMLKSIAGATGSRTSLLPAENATGNFVKVVQRIPVKIVFDNLPRDVVLRPGMNVDATILTE